MSLVYKLMSHFCWTMIDKCYNVLAGAMEILKNLDNFELPLIYSGTLCADETSRVKRLARLDCLKLPKFLDDLEGYRQQLRWIGYVNGILPKPAPRKFKSMCMWG